MQILCKGELLLALLLCGGCRATLGSQPTVAHEASPAPVAQSLEPGAGLPHTGDSVDTLHGVEVPDPFRWLEQADSPETRAWAQAQDARARQRLEALPGRAGLLRRLEALSYIEWAGAPVQRGGRLFYERRPAGQEKAILYWQRDEADEARVLLDPAKLSADGHVALKGWWPSHDGHWLVYTLSENNADEATLHLLEVQTGEQRSIDRIPGARYARPAWLPDGSGFYYTRWPLDPAIPVDQRPGKAAIYLHLLGAPYTRDALVFAATDDPTLFISPSLSRDGRYLFVHRYHGWTRNDVLVRDLHRDEEFQPLVEGLDAHFFVRAWRGRFYILTDLDAPRWRLMTSRPRQPIPAQWTELVPEREGAVLEDFHIAGGRLLLHHLRNARSELSLARLDGTPLRDLPLPEIGSVKRISAEPELARFYYTFSSFTAPTRVLQNDGTGARSAPYFQLKAPVDSSRWTTEQIWYPSADGTPISMFLIRPVDLPRDGQWPTLLTGYGGFSVSLTPSFNPRQFVWLEQGGILAIPNLRGGGEYGEQWHRAGMREHKQRVFDDFIAAAEHLVAEGYTSPARLAISGGSNGGLLVGAAMTQRPELFRAVICAVPLLDMLRYHLFGAGRTWISEYGSAEDASMFPVLLAYSPYHRLKAGTRYPALLMLSADSDDRVDPMHARKFVARMQAAQGASSDVLLRIETASGHGGGDMVKKRLERAADRYGFLFDRLGVETSYGAAPEAGGVRSSEASTGP